jgi:hypothetical protein
LFDWFPAIAFSALVVPFGLVSHEENFSSFSQMFFKKLVPSLVVAISAAALYGIIFFFGIPMLKDKEEELRFRGNLYHLAKEHAYMRSSAGDWVEASQFLSICDQVWKNSPELNSLRTDIEIQLDKLEKEEHEGKSLARASLDRDWRDPAFRPVEFSALSGRQPFDAVQALSMAGTALKERRYFDAHWLASLAQRISVEGSAQAASAARLASEAWNMIADQSPSRREERLFSLYEKKLSGYQAMNASDWITAYYIFLELSGLTPDDPDVKNFLAASEKGLQEYAFFIDEMQLSLGEILNGALFSIPAEKGRIVMRFSSLSTTPDVAYGMGFEFMQFDLLSHPITSMRSTYAKLLPVTVNNKHQIMVVTHTLSRYNKGLSWESEWIIGKDEKGGVIMLDISYEDLLLLAEVRHGLSNLQMGQLYLAAQELGNSGYIPQIFQSEILYRIGSVIFFLPVAIFVIVIGWRYRAKSKPRYLFILLLPVLPFVFHGFVNLYRSVINTVGICLVITLGFSAALAVLIVALVVILLISMITLAAQHS